MTENIAIALIAAMGAIIPSIVALLLSNAINKRSEVNNKELRQTLQVQEKTIKNLETKLKSFTERSLINGFYMLKISENDPYSVQLK